MLYPSAFEHAEEFAVGYCWNTPVPCALATNLFAPGPFGQEPRALQFGSIIAICAGPTPFVPGAKEYVLPLSPTTGGSPLFPPGQTCVAVAITFPLGPSVGAQGYKTTPSCRFWLGTLRCSCSFSARRCPS